MLHRDTLQLFQYWTQQRADRRAPERADIAPAAISSLIGNMFILEGDQDQTRFRLAGTRLCSAFGLELRGLGLADLFAPRDRTLIAKALNAVSTAGDLVVGEALANAGDDQPVTVELLLLPLSDENVRILGSLQLVDEPYWIGSKPLGSLDLVTLQHVDPDQHLISLANRPPLMLPGERRKANRSRIWHVLDGGRTLTSASDRDPNSFSIIDGGRND